MTTKGEWVAYTGSDEQIAEIYNAENGVLYRLKDGKESEPYYHITSMEFIHYWIIPDDPLREMKIRWAQTGQPVWVKMKSSTYWIIAMRGFDLIYQDHVVSVIKSTTPDWNIPGAEYSFTPFEE